MLARVRVGDVVQVVSGKDKGSRGKVLALSKDRVRVQNIALVTKFIKVRPQGVSAQPTKGSGIQKVERFIHISNVMPICPQTDKPCRVRTVVTDSGEKIRVSAKSGLKV